MQYRRTSNDRKKGKANAKNKAGAEAHFDASRVGSGRNYTIFYLSQKKVFYFFYFRDGIETHGRLRQEFEMKTYLHGPMDYAKSLKLQFRARDLNLPERRSIRVVGRKRKKPHRYALVVKQKRV